MTKNNVFYMSDYRKPKEVIPVVYIMENLDELDELIDIIIGDGIGDSHIPEMIKKFKEENKDG